MKASMGLSVFALLAINCLPGAFAQEALWQEFFDAGKASSQKGDFAQAEKQLSAALASAQRSDSPDSAIMQTIKSLSAVYVAQKKYEQASAVLLKLLALDERTGIKSDYCADLHALAQISRKQGKLGDAQKYLQKAVEVAREHKDDTANLSSLLIEEAVVYEQEGAFTEVEPLLLEALNLRVKSLEAGDLQIIASMEQLADFYTTESRYAEAVPLYKRCIASREKTQNGQGTSLIRDLVSLAMLNKEQGKSEEAEAVLKRAVAISEKQFGVDGLELANELVSLARFYSTDDRPSLALPLLLRALTIRANSSGNSGAGIADVYVLLGNAYLDKDDYLLAEKNLFRALSIDEKDKDGDPLRVARDLSSIGKLQLSQGKYELAEDAYKQALTITSKVRGAEHPDTATSMNNLALLERNRNKYRESEELLREALAIREKAFGGSHPVVAQNLINLADVLAAADKPSEAEPLLARALSIDTEALGADHEHVAMILRDLIDVLTVQKSKDGQAERLSRRLLARDSRIMGSGNLLIARDMEALARILVREGKISDARTLKENAAEIFKKQQALELEAPVAVRGENTGIQLQPVKDKWALVIGISTFQEPSLNLKYAAKDATDFRNFLVSEANFKPDHVKLLTDKDATRANIVALLGDKWLKRVANPDDVTLIYISGHGTQSSSEADGANFIVPYEGNRENIVFSGLPMQWLLAGLKNLVRCDRTYLFLDVCHGGAAASVEKKSTVRSNELNNTEDSKDSKSISRLPGIEPRTLSTATGQVVVAASQADQVSWESKRYANGVFTRNLIKGLKINGEHTTMSQAFDYLKDSVEEEVLRDRAQLQTPVIVPKLSQGEEAELCGKPVEPRSALVTPETDTAGMIPKKADSKQPLPK